MASNKKLNPNAAPYLISPDHVIPRKITPAPLIQPVFFYYQPVPNWGCPDYPNPFHFNVYNQANFFEPKEAVKERKLRNLAPRFRNDEKMVSLGGKEQQWLPKKSAEKYRLIKQKEVDVKLGGKKSLMIRNIPNQLQRQDLMQILDKHCLQVNKNKAKVKSAYDFMYLPIDFKTGGNFGYAFVNFTNCAAAKRFYKAFNNFEWDVTVNKKTCEICCANIQGKAALVDHFKKSVFKCSHSDYLPVVFTPPRDGVVRSRVNVIGRYIENPYQAML